MPDWNSRLAVSYQDETGSTHQISPIESFSPTFALGAEPLHSLERTHLGVLYNPSVITFTLSVRAIGDSAAELTTLALRGQRFDVILQPTEESEDWSFAKVVMKDCIITSAAPSAATIAGAPLATFSGFSLAGEAEPANGPGVQIP